MRESFGARIRALREQKGVALATISAQTKIKLSLLEGLERDDLAYWPDGLFRRAFVRAYAQAVGLDPDLIVREFLAHHPDPSEVIPTAPDPVARGFFRYFERFRRRRATSPANASDAPVVPRARAPLVTEPDLSAAAALCTELSCIEDARQVPRALEEAARILNCVGLILWSWESRTRELRPAYAHGYSDAVLAQLPNVRRDSDNAVAAAFQAAAVRIVSPRGKGTGAVVVPLMANHGCVGVLALELQHGDEQHESVPTLATIFAAQLVRLVAPPANSAGVAPAARSRGTRAGALT